MEPVFFFDDGGVLSDNRRRGVAWKELIAQYFIPRYGGSEKEWSLANTVALDYYMKERLAAEELSEIVDTALLDHLDEMWLRIMFDHLDIPPPPEDELLDLSRAAANWILPRVQASFDGMVQIVDDLANQGYTLHTASAEREYELDGYLSGMGIRQHFDQLFGVDKLGYYKKSSNFYDRIFNEVGISPQRAIVIEDSPEMIWCIEQTGATAVQSRLTGEYEPVTILHFSQVHELVRIITSITQR